MNHGEPVTTDGSGPQVVPAGWHPDPSGRHHYRWWDGAAWTATVADGVVTTTDPLPAPPQPVARPLAAPYLGPLEAVRMGFHRYADFRGRASRPEYWWWALFNLVAIVVTLFVAGVTRFAGGWILVIAALVILTLYIPTLSVTCRRLHDSGRSGWLQLLAFAPFVAATNDAIGGSPAAIILISLSSSIVLIVLCSLPSDEGPNRFGPAWY